MRKCVILANRLYNSISRKSKTKKKKVTAIIKENRQRAYHRQETTSTSLCTYFRPQTQVMYINSQKLTAREQMSHILEVCPHLSNLALTNRTSTSYTHEPNVQVAPKLAVFSTFTGARFIPTDFSQFSHGSDNGSKCFPHYLFIKQKRRNQRECGYGDHILDVKMLLLSEMIHGHLQNNTNDSCLYSSLLFWQAFKNLANDYPTIIRPGFIIT